MKLRTLIMIVLITAPVEVFALDMAAGMNDQAVSCQQQNDHAQQVAPVTPDEKNNVVLNALIDRKAVNVVPDLYSETEHSNPTEAGIVEVWQERVFKALGMNVSPRQPDLVNDSGLRSNTEFGEQGIEMQTVSKVMLKETVKLARERLHEIDRLVKALQFEVSTDMLSKNNAETEVVEKETGEALTGRKTVALDRFFIKTELRTPVVGGRFSLVSETNARYGKMSSFFKVRLDGRHDSSLGLLYVLSRDAQLQVERQVAHDADPSIGDRTNAGSTSNLVQLVCKF